MEFIEREMRDGDLLFHVHAGGRAHVPGFLEDYGAVGNALATMYETTLEPRWLGQIRWAADQVVSRFWDDDKGAFYDTAADGERLVVRPREPTESVTPSGTSLAVELLLRAAHLFGDEGYRAVALRAIHRETGGMERFPSALGGLLAAVDRITGRPVELAVVGDRDDPGTKALLDVALTRYLPTRTIAGKAPDEELSETVPLLDGREQVDGRPTAFLCEGYACQAPVTEPGALAEQLEDRG